MATANFDFGMIGLGVMGRNFILNVADHGFSAIGLDRSEEQVAALREEGSGKPIEGTSDTASFVQALRKPRKIMLLVPAGKIVDAVIDDLLPLLDKGDLIIDGGNSYFEDTNHRFERLADSGIHFMGIGVSGGAEGARKGPSMMPGGPQEAYTLVQPILESVAAKVQGDPCVAWLGNRSAGNYVKMVHNGIEYGLMQLLAEAYDIMKRGLGLDNATIHKQFAAWNSGRLQSFLVEITASVFTERDNLSEADLIDVILDKAKQKGTGKWTSQNAMDLGMPIPAIDMAVTMRGLSSFKADRATAASLYPGEAQDGSQPDQADFLAQLEAAVYFAFILTYAQGMTLLQTASKEYDYALDLETVARIWRGGCIIRAALLEEIMQAYREAGQDSHLLLTNRFADKIASAVADTRQVMCFGISKGIPLGTLGACLSYFDAFRSERMPTNLIQAQRDFFGSHTYERADREGIFHTDWGSSAS